MSRTVNVHGTAIVIGTTGLIFVGPSGSGKTAAALHCIGRAGSRGLFSALVADDQVMVSLADTSVIARPPSTIAGLAEVRGAAIVSVPSIPGAILSHAIGLVRPPFSERLAPEGEEYELMPGQRLPLTRLPIDDGFDCFERLLHLLPILAQN
jgi:serine kinase of HPr protein (carbohydrate metabolism regulator)